MNQFTFIWLIRRAVTVVAWSVLGWLFLAGAPAKADATTLSDNTSQTAAGSLSASSFEWLAAGFVSDANYTDVDLEVVLAAAELSGATTLALYSSDSSGQIPEGLLKSFSLSSTAASSLTFSLSDVDVLANTSYWLVLSNATGLSTWAWTEASEGVGAGFTGAWANSDDAGSSWFTNSPLYPLQATVKVGIPQVPEPATTALWLGLLPVWLLARKRSTLSTETAHPV
jgi:hypothetical protein